MTVCTCSWCSGVVDDHMTQVGRGDRVFHLHCYGQYQHAKRHARTDLLPLVDTKLVQQIQTRIPPMNEADKATAPSSAATDFGPMPSLTGKSQEERDAIIAQNLCVKCGKPRHLHVMHDLTPICPSSFPTPLPATLHRPIPAADPVNHPKHYTSHPSGVECITVTEHMGFNLGNAVKYIWRADLKADALEDLKKARWYLDREIAKRSKP